MRLKAEQLPAALRKSLAPVYLLSGDEPLQLGEAADDVRQAARQAGYGVREVVNIDTGHEWPQLTAEADALSVFADRKLIDLRLPSAKPGVEGGKVLQNYCRQPPADTLLLITAGKLESAAQKSAWFQAVDQVGVVVQVWPLQGHELLQWLQRRAERRQLRIDADALKSLAARIEGNLLAAAQEIEKLYVLHGHAAITRAMVEADVADSSRFDAFNFADALLAGKLNRASRILTGLRQEGVAPPVVLWAVSREVRLLAGLQAGLQQGGDLETLCRKHQVWDKRKPLVREALARLDAGTLRRIELLAAECDREIKGLGRRQPWEALFRICVLFASGAHDR